MHATLRWDAFAGEHSIRFHRQVHAERSTLGRGVRRAEGRTGAEHEPPAATVREVVSEVVSLRTRASARIKQCTPSNEVTSGIEQRVRAALARRHC